MSPRRRKTDKHLPQRVYLKSGSYYYVTPGENKWIKLGKTEADMYSALSRLRAADEKRNAGGMAAVFHRYREEVVPAKKERTQKDNLAELANLERAFGHMDPPDIRPVHVYQYLDARGKKARVRANREAALLSHVFGYCIRWGLIEANPCRDVKKHSEKPRNRYVEDWEYRIVYDQAPPLVQAAMEVATITGMRQGDILKLERADCLAEGLRVTQAKTGKKQVFEWTPALRAAITQAANLERNVQSMWIFATSNGARITASGFQTAWQRLMNKITESGSIAERFTFHDLRSKAASDYSGDSTALMGHQSPATTKRHYERKPTKIRPDR